MNTEFKLATMGSPLDGPRGRPAVRSDHVPTSNMGESESSEFRNSTSCPVKRFAGLAHDSKHAVLILPAKAHLHRRPNPRGVPQSGYGIWSHAL